VVRLSLRFDLRVAPFAKTRFAAQHRAMLEMASWADRVGIDAVSLSEHHGDPAGFSSAPIVLAAALLARTQRVRVSLAAVLAPLHDPVRLAEQLATVDCLAPGRLSAVLGAGYRRAEFAMAGIPSRERGARVEECVALAERDGQRMLHPLLGGIEPPLAWEGLRLFEAEVLPRLDRNPAAP
jgi:alkanesulfonate monooxygenase SsuD/methylene tetrahydromethanopterin reductase-like flavin-dependent oxidoreductase (luciferase family)